MKFFVISLLNLFTFSLFAQSISPSELSGIEGNWAGQLTYTDYQDDVSKFTLNCTIEAQWKNKKGLLTFFFVEPDGRIITDKTRIKLKKDGTQLIFDGKYQITDFTIDKATSDWTLDMNAVGKDNNRNAEIKCVVMLSTTQLTITKLVKYEGTDRFFERNRYAFERDE